MTTQLSTCCLQPVRTRLAPLSEEDVYQYECKACGQLCDLLPAEAPASPAGLIARIDDMLFVKPASNTPRTDALEGDWFCMKHEPDPEAVALFENVRELERELTAANARAAEWKRLALLGDDEVRSELAEAMRKLTIVAKAVDAAEALDNASTEKEVEARCTFNESMAQVCLEQEEFAHASTKNQLAESHAREAALREALSALLGIQGTVEVLGEWEALDINRGYRKRDRAKVEAVNAQCRSALAQPPPPVVPKSVADGLAEALMELKRIDMGEDIGGNCRFLPRAMRVIDAALAAYREATKP